ncbi:inovirus Gp2 family protein [Vibrio vulnificus]|nr:inovirus Gp2 family protein [Vibrio vulnificus]
MSHHIIHQGSLFNGLPVNTNYSLITRYLEQTHKVLNNALSEHPRSFIFPVLLRLPTDTDNDLNLERVITRFIEGFKQRVQRSIGHRKKTAQRVHATSVRYAWCREQDSSIHQHYHVFFLLNGQTYHQMGDYSYENKHHLRYMVVDAWAKTLGTSIHDNKGLVEFPGKPVMLNVQDITSTRRYCKYVGRKANDYESVFYWMSYLAKVDTKQSGNGFRSFGSSMH